MDDIDLAVQGSATRRDNGPPKHYTFEFEFGNDYTYSPAPELGLSRVSRSREVFNITPQK